LSSCQKIFLCLRISESTGGMNFYALMHVRNRPKSLTSSNIITGITGTLVIVSCPGPDMIDIDPSPHDTDNWMEEYPTADLPPSVFPVLVPYPPPHYAAQTSTLIYLTKPMPSPPPRQTQPQDLSVKSEVAEDRKPGIKTEDAPSLCLYLKVIVANRYEFLFQGYKPQDELLTLVAAYNATRTGRGRWL